MRKSTYLSICLAIIFPTLFLQTVPLQAQKTKELIKITDLLKIQSIGEVTMSKDGNKAAFTVTAIEPDPDSKSDYKYVNHIYLVLSDGTAAPKELTVKESSSQPSWSPDGKQLAFVRAVDGKPQVFILSLDGGEPSQFTHYKYGAGTPKWSPDGGEILFSSSIRLKDMIKDSLLNPGHQLPVWPYEQAGFDKNESLQSSLAKADPDGNMEEIRAYLDNDVTDKKAKLVNKLNFQDETGVNAELSLNQFFVQALPPGSPPRAVTFGFYRYNTVDFTPDGRLLITANIDSTEHPDRALESSIYLADKDGKNIRLLQGEKGKVFSNATLSPSGKFLAFQYSTTSFVTVPQLAVLSLNGKGPGIGKTGEASDRGIIMELPFDRAKGNYTWSADEKFLYFTAQSNGGVPLYRVNVSSGKTEQLSDYNSGTGSFDLQGGRLVFVRTAINDPFELYTADPILKDPKRISAFNYDWVQGKQLVQPEKHEFKNDKGMTIEYWVMKPANYSPGKKYPLLLDIHGGPSAMWGPGESSMWHEFQYFCSRGYGVVYCNPRGSGGYGLDFLRGNVEDWGTGPASDVLAVLDKTVGEGWADMAKLVVSGGS
jgi:dipeptidyl aminopeptidase/acylaminoacyl peptidase